MSSPITTPGYRYAKESYPLDGVNIDFEFNFDGGYIDESYITAWVRDTLRNETQISPSNIEFTGPNTVRIATAVSYPTTHTLIIRRETPKEQPLVNFINGATLNETNLNKNTRQAIHSAAEMVDYFADLLADFYEINENVINAVDLVNTWTPELISAIDAILELETDMSTAEIDIVGLKADVLALQTQYNNLEFEDLNNVPALTGNAGKFMRVNALENGLEAADAAAAFTELSDVPSSYTGQAGKVSVVKDTEDGIEFVNIIAALNDKAIITCTFDGGGSPVASETMTDVVVPYSCVINKVSMLADLIGNIEISIWKDTYANFPPTIADSITGGSAPNITGNIKSEDVTLTGWNTTIEAGSVLRFKCTSCSVIQHCVINLHVTKT